MQTNTRLVLSKSARSIFSAMTFVAATLGVTHAQAVTLTFEGLKDFEYVEGYYAGGKGSLGSGPGLNLGISFTGEAYTSIDADVGGTGNFGGEPSPSTAISFQQGSAFMNVTPGFVGKLSFYYTNPNGASNVKLYSGLNGTGLLLATLFLPETPYQGQMDPTGNHGPFVYKSVDFNGVARSVDFIALAHRAYVDDITLSPVPEPESGLLSLLGVGILGLAGIRRARG